MQKANHVFLTKEKTKCAKFGFEFIQMVFGGLERWMQKLSLF